MQTRLLCHTAEMSAASHRRHVCCVTEQTCQMSETADMPAEWHSKRVCCVRQQTLSEPKGSILDMATNAKVPYTYIIENIYIHTYVYIYAYICIHAYTYICMHLSPELKAKTKCWARKARIGANTGASLPWLIPVWETAQCVSLKLIIGT